MYNNLVEEDSFSIYDKHDYSDIFMSSTDPVSTMNGYVVSEDGTIHSLLQQWSHGIVLAALFPELLKTLVIEEDDLPRYIDDVFRYQRIGFDLEKLPEVNVIQVSFSMLSSLVSFNKTGDIATPQQITAVAKIAKQFVLKQNDTVNTTGGDMNLRKMMQWLAEPGSWNKVNMKEEY